MSDSVMAAVDTFYKVYNDHDMALWNDAMAPNYVGHVNADTVPSREIGAGFVKGLIDAFPDIHYTVEDRLLDGSRVVCRWSATGTHTGNLFGMPPTNKHANMIGITIFRVENGQIAELWDMWDQAGLMAQLNK
ncbi:MAG TPA: ester cyclase [Devosiaceae bacterium]|nr:ester cyclase [Devosiaceae bacterium]